MITLGVLINVWLEVEENEASLRAAETAFNQATGEPPVKLLQPLELHRLADRLLAEA
ncbi:MAG TPA: hypothetical protein VGG68_15640 [Caulobacteraceae bacterium]|jgi:hypothetical protein